MVSSSVSGVLAHPRNLLGKWWCVTLGSFQHIRRPYSLCVNLLICYLRAHYKHNPSGIFPPTLMFPLYLCSTFVTTAVSQGCHCLRTQPSLPREITIHSTAETLTHLCSGMEEIIGSTLYKCTERMNESWLWFKDLIFIYLFFKILLITYLSD